MPNGLGLFERLENTSPRIRSWVDDEDPLHNGEEGEGGGRGSRERLLEGMEAGSVTAAMELDGKDEDEVGGERYDWEREVRRPKSGVGSAFMNMANSIIGAGIIGGFTLTFPFLWAWRGRLCGSRWNDFSKRRGRLQDNWKYCEDAL